MAVLRCMLGAFEEHFLVINGLLRVVQYVRCGANWNLGVELRVGRFVLFIADEGAAAVQLGRTSTVQCEVIYYLI